MPIQKPTLSIFTSPKNIGNIIREQHNINVKFTEFNVPFTEESGNTAINWKGKTRVIMVQGIHDGTGFDGADQNSKLADFIFEIEQWIGGNNELLNIQASAIYTSSFNVGYNVKCFDWQWTRSFSDPNRINYTLLLHRV